MNKQDLVDYRANDRFITEEIRHYKAMRARTNGIDTNEVKELNNRYNKMIRDLNKQQHHQMDILDKLRSMSNPIDRNILFMRYIEGMSLKEISIELNMAYSYVKNYIQKSLEEFNKICK